MTTSPIAPKIFLVEFGAAAWVGHRASTLAAMRDELIERGVEVICGVSAQATADVLQALDAKPTFSLLPWPMMFQDSISGDIDNFLHYGETAPPEFEKLLANAVTTDIVILNTTSESELWAYALWLETRDKTKRPKTVLNVLLPHFFDPVTEEPTMRGRLLRSAIKRLVSVQPPEDLLFLTLTDRMRVVLDRLTGVHFAVSATPLDLSVFVPKREEQGAKGPVRIAVAGQPKATKGVDLIPEIARSMFSLRPEVVFHAQNWPVGLDAPSNVQTIKPGVDQSTYNNFIKSCDVSLIMYDPTYYKHGASGIFEEAASSGHGVVVTNNTWMAPFVDMGVVAGESVAYGDTRAAVDALCRLIDNIEDLRSKKILSGSAWTQTRGVGAYLDQVLIELCPQPEQIPTGAMG